MEDRKAEEVDGYNDSLMLEAFAAAREALAVGEVPVGCVFVDSAGEVVARGRNEVNATGNATRHAELVAVDRLMPPDSADTDVFSRLTVYVNVEPCIM